MALVAFFNAAPVAIAHVANHDVAGLALWGGYARGTDLYPLAPSIPRDVRVIEAQWGAVLETAARLWTADLEEAGATALYFRACVAADAALRYARAAREWDVTALLALARARTLVIQRRDTAAQQAGIARALAAAITGAELVLLPGEAASPFSGDVDAGADTVARFLGLGPSMPATAPAASVPPPLPASITAREIEVLALLARGFANKEIGARLGLSVNTVERHLTNLYPKIGARGRTEATAFAIRHGLA